MSDTPIRFDQYRPTRACYAKSGTERAYGATAGRGWSGCSGGWRTRREVRYPPTLPYALAMRCPVLPQRILLYRPPRCPVLT
eukprot:910053-Rhodomonas_salina.1